MSKETRVPGSRRSTKSHLQDTETLHQPAVAVASQPHGTLAIAGVRLSAVLTKELFCHSVGMPQETSETHLAEVCARRFASLANQVACFPTNLEVLLVLCNDPGAAVSTDCVHLALLTIARNRNDKAAIQASRRSCEDLASIASVALDFINVDAIRDYEELSSYLTWLTPKSCVEITRRSELLELGHGAIARRTVGFTRDDERPTAAQAPTLEHLYPWHPPRDSWHGLAATLAQTPAHSALLVHMRNIPHPDDSAVCQARSRLAAAERLNQHLSETTADTFLASQAQLLRDFALVRLSITQNRCLSARLFVASAEGVPNPVLTGVLTALDGAHNAPDDAAHSLFCGGAATRPCTATELMEVPDSASLGQLFSPDEASAFLRTPLPPVSEIQGFSICHSRTALLAGSSGHDAPLGTNVHRTTEYPVRLDEDARFRHTYLVGQTGTGKSTLMLHMALHDINAGRGVAVIDPHGSLVDDILLRFPAQRADDLVVVDLTDAEYPVGFNILCIDEEVQAKYLYMRDMVIDDIHSYMSSIYLKDHLGPIFESNLRGILALLMGQSKPPRHLVPNLMLFRSVYSRSNVRAALASRCRGEDFVLDEFIMEANAAGGDMAISNIAPYVTSKFTRFISDSRLRNITCQGRMLDLASIVNGNKVLLVNLGKGHFGDQAAGLLAAQILTRVRHAILQRGTQGRANPFFLYADEFHLLADERFAELLAEARKFGLALTLAHQHTDQLPEKVLQSVLGNVGTSILFRVGPKDASMLRGLLHPRFSEADLISMPNYQALVKPSGDLGERPFSISTLPPSAKTDATTAAHLRRLSALTYARPREEVEREILATYRQFLNPTRTPIADEDEAESSAV